MSRAPARPLPLPALVLFSALCLGRPSSVSAQMNVYVVDQVANAIVHLDGLTGVTLGVLPLGPDGIHKPTGLGVAFGFGAINDEAVVLDQATQMLHRYNLLTGAHLGAVASPSPYSVGVGHGYIIPGAPPNPPVTETFVVAYDDDFFNAPRLFWINPVTGVIINQCTLPFGPDALDCAATAQGANGTLVYMLEAVGETTNIHGMGKLNCGDVLIGNYPWRGWGLGAGTMNIAVGAGLMQVLYVSDLDNNCLHVVDPGTGLEVGTIPLGPGVIGPNIRGLGVSDADFLEPLPALAACQPAVVPVQGGGGNGGGNPFTLAGFLQVVNPEVPMLRSRAGSSFVHVGGACSPEDTLNSTHGPGDVWCFEGAGGDSSWPANPNGGSWTHEGDVAHRGAPGDFWHLTFDPNYLNRGNTCTFSDDWMWAAKPDASPIPSQRFSYLLASPAIPVSDWLGGFVEYDTYQNTPPELADVTNFLARTYDFGTGWSPWHDLDGVVKNGGGTFWNMNVQEDLTPLLGAPIDSIQVGFQMMDLSRSGEWSWGRHSGVEFLVDNVSFTNYDDNATKFETMTFSLFSDTFSRSDPAHTSLLANESQGQWSGIARPGYDRPLASAESLSVDVSDTGGLSGNNVVLYWRHDNGDSGTFGPWMTKPMVFSSQDPNAPLGEGTYRQSIGADDGSVEDVEGTAGNGLIWPAGTTVEYYIQATDDAFNPPVDFPTGPPYFEFTVLPTGRTTPDGDRILLVNDYEGWVVDFENSTAFILDGGTGGGNFTDPAYTGTGDLAEYTLAELFGGSPQDPLWDRYDVYGAATDGAAEPRANEDALTGLGGYLTAAGTPAYDALIWLNGENVHTSYSVETRQHLATYLDAGGMLLSAGDNVAAHLGSGGGNADSTLRFLATYLGTSFPTAADDRTDEKILRTAGVGGTSLDGVEILLYADCPGFREFDRLTLASPIPGSTNAVLMEYSSGGAGDNGRASVIRNVRAGGGVAVQTGFDLSALNADGRACVLGRVLATEFGFTVPYPPPCLPSGLSAPVATTFDGPFGLNKVSPNPATGATKVEFVAARRGRVRIEIYDVAGRSVRTLLDGTVDGSAAPRTVTWDGRRQDGSAVVAGIYFVRLSQADRTDVRKVVRLR